METRELVLILTQFKGCFHVLLSLIPDESGFRPLTGRQHTAAALVVPDRGQK